MTDSWAALLDALEERTRRLRAVIERPAAEDGVPPFLFDLPPAPAEPLPEPQRPRAAALLAETRRLEALATVGMAECRRAQRYSAV